MALAASSGNSSDAEKDSDIDTPESREQERQDEEVTESTSLLYKHRRANTYDGVAVKDKAEIWANGQSVPNVVYASPVRPHLPSPLTPNSRVGGVASASTGIILFASFSADMGSRWVFTAQLADASDGAV